MKLRRHSNEIIPIILAAGRGSRMGNLTKNKPKSFVKNEMLNEMLNDVAQSGEWRNLDANPYTSNQAQGFVQGGSMVAAPTQDIDGRPVDTSNPEVANVVGAITKDYSQLMKAIDKKKGR